MKVGNFTSCGPANSQPGQIHKLATGKTEVKDKAQAFGSSTKFTPCQTAIFQEAHK